MKWAQVFALALGDVVRESHQRWQTMTKFQRFLDDVKPFVMFISFVAGLVLIPGLCIIFLAWLCQVLGIK